MKARHQIQLRKSAGAANSTKARHASPNSSAILAVTVLATVEDVLAVVRTATLLGKTFEASTSVDVLGEDAIHIEAGEDLTDGTVARLLDAIKDKLRNRGSQEGPKFAVEASIAAASFLAAGSISVNIRGADLVPSRPIVAR